MRSCLKAQTWNFRMNSSSGPKRENVRCPWVNPDARYWNLTANWLKPDTAHTRMVRECQHPAHFYPAHNAFDCFWAPQSWEDAELQNNLKPSRHSPQCVCLCVCMKWTEKSKSWHIRAMLYLERNQISLQESATLNTFILYKKNVH